ncbi:Peptidoglycan/LPS O-acetylase OafA/YrhL, contains acyltransferase and SGNH-hydrolase domains [Bradyrhizobium brasilense]|uniref:Peptidoglycan/LPS O-acetylase OafA/YrhL, contains acyltransferase and SGNH-hydrolase domains n=1 Tax=Bradyrhizobium brasilense TaxID=1419277 RepID=A0A1G6L6S6_9BRAD|nr:acyltransferase [Bradyrhizobium brasilense]SDC38808.1 Peptidoglycan/LPS O-acetylase OafA/YrhL, contains acyltransferase and SGNH-hydrolase domains [Bradyrhizobium brasilense]
MEQERLPGLQIARAVAALSIVYFHSWVALTRFPPETSHPIPFLRDHGSFGVDLFFAISGFVICLVVSRASFSTPAFLVKRIFRLYPLWLLTLTSFAMLAMAWRGMVREQDTFAYFLWSASLLPTEHFPFYDIGWSLQHEMAFYLIAAAIVPRLGVVGLVCLLAAAAALNQALELPWYLANFPRYYPDFLAGCLAFLARPHLARFGAATPLAIGGVLAWILLYNMAQSQLMPIALFFLIIGFVNVKDRKSWAMATGSAIGDASYSIYLIHPMVFLVASAIVSKLTLPIWSQEPIRFGCFVVVLVISALSWKLYERPMMRLGNRILPRKPSYICEGAAAVQLERP